MQDALEATGDVDVVGQAAGLAFYWEVKDTHRPWLCKGDVRG